MNQQHPASRRAAHGILFLLLSAGVLLSGQSSPVNPSASKSKMAEEAFKNIQVLKGIPSDQLVPAMQFITFSLGVECSYCHVEGAFEKDDKKPKQAARKMMQMMSVINRDNFDGKREVTCYSCHRGFPHPVATPLIAEGGTPVPQEVPVVSVMPPAEAPGPEQILAKYVEAIGGASAIEKLSSRAEKGSIDISGRQFPVELFSKVPGRRVLIIHLPSGDNITALDGNSGWISTPGRPPHEISVLEMSSARLEADLQLPIHFRQFFSEIKMKTGNAEKIGDHDVYVVTGGSAGEVMAEFCFDEHSGLLLRMLRYSDSPLGRNPTQVDYSDYRDEGKVKVPFQRTISTPRSHYSIRIERVQDNVPIDEKIFTRPAVAPLPGNPPSR
jgi:photosynthetic reaction center cytochrome c subunit